MLKANGFKTAMSSTCIFHHPVRDVMVFVHGDDFVSTAEGEDLEWFKSILETKFELKSKIIGHDDGDEGSVKILNRIIIVTHEGFEYEPDLRHAELVIKDLG